jgi:hypothetical protein
MKIPFYKRLIAIVFCSVCFMAFMPFGTFDPTKFQFYWCIVTAIVSMELTIFLLKKFAVKREH